MIKEAGKIGGTHPAVFNAANEEAVAAFHAGAIRFTDIVDSVHACWRSTPAVLRLFLTLI